jgi:ankyrin repeat protein
MGVAMKKTIKPVCAIFAPTYEQFIEMIEGGDILSLSRIKSKDVKKMINRKAKDGDYPLHKAVMVGNPAMVQYLVSLCGADTKVVDKDGKRPLGLARSNSDDEIITLLEEIN